MKDFIRSLSVRLVSCHEVKPRRRRRPRRETASEVNDDVDAQDDLPVSKAYRVCINSDDKHLLLNDEKWPAYVAICDWFFKKSYTNEDTQVKRRRVDEQRSSPATANGRFVDSHRDMDSTILAGTPGYSDTVNSMNQS